MLFLSSVQGSKTGKRLTLPRMNCTASKDDIPISEFRRCRFQVRIFFVMKINKAKGQSIPGTLVIDLHCPCFSHGQLYVSLAWTTNSRNFFILTTNGFNRASNAAFSQLFGMRHNITRFRKSVVLKHRDPKPWEFNGIYIVNLLNFENVSLIAILS